MEGKKAAEMRKGGAVGAAAEDWPQKDAKPIPKEGFLTEAERPMTDEEPDGLKAGLGSDAGGSTSRKHQHSFYPCLKLEWRDRESWASTAAG